MKNSSFNLFTELNADAHSVNTKNNVMVNAINAALTTEGENQLILQNMRGNEDFSALKDGYRPVSVTVFNNIAYILSAKFNPDGSFVSAELGTFPSPDWNAMNGSLTTITVDILPKYSPLKNFLPITECNPGATPPLNANDINSDIYYRSDFNSANFNLLSDRLAEIEIQPSYDDSVNIIITDNYNPIRLINSRFKVLDGGKRAQLANRRQGKDTNTYSDYRFTATKLLRTADTITTLEFLEVGPGGHHRGGGYRFYFRYIDTDGTLSDVIEESRLVVMSFDNYGALPSENTGKAVTFRLSNLDKKFSGVKVYFSKGNDLTTPVTTTYEIQNIYDIPAAATSINLTIFGNENITPYNADKLNINYSNIYSVRTITQFDDRLLLGNLSFNTDIYTPLKNASTKIRIKERNDIPLKIKGLGEGYARPQNVYNELGYWSGETYEIGIVYILNDYSLSPAFTVRGHDNFYGNNTYTGANLTSTFFNGNENSLGVFRTYRNRELLVNGSGVSGNFAANTTKVKSLGLDFNSLNTADVNNLKKYTKGYIIVRKERDRDCLVEGYMTNTTQVPIPQKISPTGRYNTDTANAVWTNELDQIHIQDIDRRIGTYNKDIPIPFKIIPAPGRITEIVSDGNGTVNVHKPYSLQGEVVQKDDEKVKEQYWAFYPADQLADPAMMNTIFDGSQKGILASYPDVPNNWIKANSDVSGTQKKLTSASSGPGLWMYQYPSSTNDPVQENASSTKNTKIQVTFDSAAVGYQIWVVRIVNVMFNAQASDDWSDQENAVLTLKIKVFPNNSVIAITQTVTNIDSDVKARITLQSNATFPFLNEGVNDTGNLGQVQLPIKHEANDSTDGGYDDLKIYIYKFDLKIGSSTFVDGDPADVTAATPIKILNLDPIKTNFGWLSNPSDPETIGWEKKEIKYSFKYISHNTDAYSKQQFSAIEDRNVYYATSVARGNWFYTGSGGVTQGNGADLVSTGSGTAGDFFTSIHQYSEYIGVKSYSDVEQTEPVNYNVFAPLRNDVNTVNNYAGTAASDMLQRYKQRIQTDGFNLASLVRVYNSPNGNLTTDNWISKYQVGSNTDVYFAVTARKSWGNELDIFGSTPSPIVYFNSGDCYINHVYKRIMMPRGIPSIETATNPRLYLDFNQSAGLMPNGFVMPIVTQNNYNVSLRVRDDSYASEIVLYNNARTFYPLEGNIDKLRASKQKESTAYNFGYNDNFHDKVFASLNDRSPAFNTNFTNRVMVSAPSVSGSFTNGYLDFTGLNFRDYNKQLGQIIKLIAHNNDVYCVFEQGVGIIPVNQRTMVSEQDGGVFIDNAQVLAPKMQILSTEYGSDQQFSIVKTDQAIYGCDLRKNKIWRANKDGVTIISDFAVQSIIKEFKERLLGLYLPADEKSTALNFVKANYDRELNHVMFSYFNFDLQNKITIDYIRNSKSTDPGAPPLDSKSIVKTTNEIGTVYWNETLQKWVSKLSWNPLWAFNLQNKLYSFNALKNSNKLWQHFSKKVPYCNFYGEQKKFIFEFILVDKPSAQKLLQNLTIVSNKVFPSSIEYTLIEGDMSYENGSVENNSYTQLVHQRKEFVDITKIQFTVDSASNNLMVKFKDYVSGEEATRLLGAWFLGSDGKTYILDIPVGFNNVFYNKVKDENGIIIQGNLPAPITFSAINFGIIKQNVEYIEDELYVEVDHGRQKSRIRDKAIKIKLTYEGYDYVTVQTIISSFLYSFN